MKKTILYTLLSLFSVVSFSQSEDACEPAYEKTAVRHFKKGKSYIKARKNKEAIDAFKAAIETEPKHLGANYNLGKIFFRKEQYKTAKNYIRTLVTECPTFEHYELYRMGQT